MLEKLDHGHPVLRLYGQSLVARMYEKFAILLRLEIGVHRRKIWASTKGWRICTHGARSWWRRRIG
jgi:hypothetical protein